MRGEAELSDGKLGETWIDLILGNTREREGRGGTEAGRRRLLQGPGSSPFSPAPKGSEFEVFKHIFVYVNSPATHQRCTQHPLLTPALRCGEVIPEGGGLKGKK